MARKYLEGELFIMRGLWHAFEGFLALLGITGERRGEAGKVGFCDGGEDWKIFTPSPDQALLIRLTT